MTLGKTSFCDIAIHQKDNLFAGAVGGTVPSEPTFRQHLEHLAILRNVRDWIDDAGSVVRLYHDHATCEQFHRELKTDTDVAKLPSVDYKTNSLILSISTLAFNVLRRIGQTARQVETESDERRPERIRLRTVIPNLMHVAAINGSHSGRKYLRLGRICHQAKTFQAVFRRLTA